GAAAGVLEFDFARCSLDPHKNNITIGIVKEGLGWPTRQVEQRERCRGNPMFERLGGRIRFAGTLVRCLGQQTERRISPGRSFGNSGSGLNKRLSRSDWERPASAFEKSIPLPARCGFQGVFPY